MQCQRACYALDNQALEPGDTGDGVVVRKSAERSDAVCGALQYLGSSMLRVLH